MSTKAKNPKQADEYARTTKRLQSAVQRVRSQAGTGAQRQAALVEALNDLVGHLVQGHLWGAASPPAQEALRFSSATLFAEGAVSNYTDPGAASRCATALVQLAVVQLGLGLGDAADATISSWHGLESQFDEYQIDTRLSLTILVWAEYARVRTTLGDEYAAGVDGASAEESVVRLRDLVANLGEDGSRYGFLPLDADRVSAELRWLGGRARDSLALLHAAKTGYDDQALDTLSDPSNHPKTQVERLAEPLFGLYRDYADRLAMTGDADLALVTRRALTELLRGLVAVLPTPTTTQLAAAYADLSLDLVRVGRAAEALEAAHAAVQVASSRGSSPSIRLLSHTALAEVLAADGRTSEARAEIKTVLDHDTTASEPVRRLAAQVLEHTENPDSAAISGQLRDLARGTPGLHVETITRQSSDQAGADDQALAAERERAHKLEANRREAAQREQEQRQRELAEAGRADEAANAQAERDAAERARVEEQRRRDAAEAERQELKRRRAERLRGHAQEAAARAQSARSGRRAEIGGLLESAEREGQGEAEVARLHLELADLEQAELDAGAELAEALAAADSETAAPPAPRVDQDAPEPSEPEQQKPEQAEPAAVMPEVPAPHAEPSRPEPVQPEQEAANPEPPPPADELAEAADALARARAEGNRKATRQACERLVEQLRPYAQADRAGYGPRLRAALEELSGLRLRGGDLFGSRAASKEARTYQQV